LSTPRSLGHLPYTGGHVKGEARSMRLCGVVASVEPPFQLRPSGSGMSVELPAPTADVIRHQALGIRHKASGIRQQAAGSRQHAVRSRQQAAGSRHQAPGTRHQAPGSRQQAAGSRHKAPGTRHQAPGTRQQAAGSRQHAACSTQHAVWEEDGREGGCRAGRFAAWLGMRTHWCFSPNNRPHRRHRRPL
jgi:hypothetical protein